jgi:hypothetical protein
MIIMSYVRPKRVVIIMSYVRPKRVAAAHRPRRLLAPPRLCPRRTGRPISLMLGSPSPPTNRDAGVKEPSMGRAAREPPPAPRKRSGGGSRGGSRALHQR